MEVVGVFMLDPQVFDAIQIGHGGADRAIEVPPVVENAARQPWVAQDAAPIYLIDKTRVANEPDLHPGRH